MRLINLLVFFFTFYGNTFVRATMTLDLDNYDPELVKLNVLNFDHYDLEKFSTTTGDGFTDVVASGFPLWHQKYLTSELAEKVFVYTYKSVPELVQLYLTPSRNSHFFKKVGSGYEEVGNAVFTMLKDRLAKGNLLHHNQYALDLKNKNNNRQLVTMKTDTVDGVNTLTFTPNSNEFKMTNVNDGLLPVYTVDHNTDHITSVTASLKHGEPAGVTVTMVSDGDTVTKFFKKVNNTWVEVHDDAYKNLLEALVPHDLLDNLTLDVAEPNEEQFKVVKEFEPGVTKAHYTPLPKFQLSKVVNAGVPLWSSHDYVATDVHTFTSHNVLRLVKVTTKGPEGVVEDVNLEKVPGGFAPLNNQKFSQLVKELMQEGEKSRQTELPVDDSVTEGQQEEPHGVVLDVLASDEHNFTEAHGTFHGVPVKMFFPKENVNVRNVQVGTHDVWHTENGSKFVSAYLYFKDKAPKVVEVRVVDQDGEKVYNRLENDNGVWETQVPLYFEQFLKNAVNPPAPGHALEVDLNKPNNEHVTEETSKLFGVNSTTYHAEQGYHFAKVHLGDVLLWDNEHHKNAYLVKATGFFNRVLDEFGQVVLVQLEGFSGGNFVTYFLSFENNEWVGVNKQHFDRKFLELRGNFVQETPEEPVTPGNQFEVFNLDTSDVNEEKVSVVKGRASEGYYFSSYTPKENTLFGVVDGPENFHFNPRGAKLVTFVKFFYVHAKLVGARLDTVTSKELTSPLTYYYTYKNQNWNYSFKENNLFAFLTNELTYTTEQKKALDDLLKADEQYKNKMKELEKAKQKEAEKKRRKENEVVVPEKLSHKRKLFDDMVDFEQQQVPETPAPVEETEEEKEDRRQSYASEKLLVESELVYVELNNPEQNKFLHTKNYETLGLKTLDLTPVVGKWVHVVAMHGKRVWVSSSNKRCTNLQLYYDNEEVMGAVLRVTTSNHGKLKTGDYFDYLFLLEGELKKVSDKEFVTMANRRFQKVGLTNASRTA